MNNERHRKIAVLDTNILVGSILHDAKPPKQILTAVKRGGIRLQVTPPILEEYRFMFSEKRRKHSVSKWLRINLTEDHRSELESLLAPDRAINVEGKLAQATEWLSEVRVKDRNDRMFLLAAGAAVLENSGLELCYLISDDASLHTLTEVVAPFGIVAVTSEFFYKEYFNS